MSGRTPVLATLPRPLPGQPYRVVFVCTGNICRSPMAEVVTRSEADATTLGETGGEHDEADGDQAG